MTVRSCEENGKPGYQWRDPNGSDGACHIYDPDDVQGRDAALRAAARDAVAAVSTEAEQQ